MPRVTLQTIRTNQTKWRVPGGWQYQNDYHADGQYLGSVFAKVANKQIKKWTVAAQEFGGGRVEYADLRWLLEQVNEHQPAEP